MHVIYKLINGSPNNEGAIAIEEGENPGGPFSASFDVCELRTLNSASGSPPLSHQFIDLPTPPHSHLR